MATTVDVNRMSSGERIGQAMQLALPMLPAEARLTVQAMLEPRALALIAATLGVWVGSHLFGIGEIVDVVLLGAGVLALGFAVFEGAEELLALASEALNARTSAHLESAARHFARAVNILGISAVQALLLRGQGRAAVARGRPQIQARVKWGRRRPPATSCR
ncbi:MAG: hypothetical protein LCI02_13100 [Proteobacteria bacterium]|nr:hypothetical protein [Pseudomonadota bacterium]